jgi:hypothetical protein
MNIIHPCNDDSGNDEDNWRRCRVTQPGLGKGEGARRKSSDLWVVAMGVSVAAQLLDGIILLCCKLMHALMHPQHNKQELQ